MAVETSARAHRRRLAAGLTALGAVAVLAAVAVAAVDELGRPAPRPVQKQLHDSVAAIFVSHSDLTKRRARVLARARDAVLYGIDDDQADYCIELLGANRGLTYGFSCRSGIRVVGKRGVTGGEVDSPVTSVVVDGVVPPVVHFGRLASGTVAARAVYADGSTEKITIGSNGFFVYEPNAAHMQAARRGSMVIQFLERDGTPLTYQLLPQQPFSSTGKHFDHISGRTVITDAVELQITIQSGTSRRGRTINVPISSDGRFSWDGKALRPLEFPTFVVVDNRRQPLTNVVTPLAEPTWRKYLAAAVEGR